MKVCPRCNVLHSKPGTYCSRSCANSRVHTEETKRKVSSALKGRTTGRAFSGVNVCESCDCEFVVDCKTKSNRFCSTLCANNSRAVHGRINGRLAAAKIQKRSKNEILFASLCEQRFGNIITNEPMFNGWDADVILPTMRMAVMWNGPWHYRKITQKHSLSQVQNRDRIKLSQIEAAGYRSYVIRDDGSYNERFVHEQFALFETWIGEIGIPRRS